MNAALRKALAEAQLTETDVAAHLGVDPKTVRRWLSGQRPYPRHRWALADLLQAEEHNLWPERSQPTEECAPLSKHIRRVYAHRWQVPREVWWDLFNSAEREIGILAYSSLFIADDAGIRAVLEEQARNGVKVRLLLGDPESLEVNQRGEEEGIGKSLTFRARNALFLFQSLQKITEAEVRTHSTKLYNSIFMTENRIMVNQHIYGAPAASAPVIEIDPRNSPSVANIYKASFEEAWNQSNTYSTLYIKKEERS